MGVMLRTAMLVAAVALWCVVGVLVHVQARPSKEQELIAPLLPQVEGRSACFRGTFSDHTMDVEDLSRARLVPTDHLSPDGKPYMRNEAPVLKDKPVHSFTLRLSYDSRNADYDWIYDFRLASDVDGLGTLIGEGECPWYAHEKPDARSGWSPNPNATSLACRIDCDGGGFDLRRVAGTRTLLLVFDPRIGLRMKAGCGGHGSYRLKPLAFGARFLLRSASVGACRTLAN